jgi:predicted phosphodiesterase
MQVIAGGDNHIPMQNKKIEEKFLKTIKDVKPDVVVLMGDVIDLESISPFTRKEKDFLLSDEILATERYLKRVKDVSGDADVYYLEGNHETRLAKYLERRADKLRDAEQFQIENVLCLEDMGINWVPHDPRRGLLLDGVLYAHYLYEVRMRAIAGKLGVDCALKANRSVCVGHGHELSAVFFTVGKDRRLGCMAGSMCTSQAGKEYVDFPKWVPGFVIMTDGYPTLVTL